MSQNRTGINRKVKTGEKKIDAFLFQETFLYKSLFNANLNQS